MSSSPTPTATTSTASSPPSTPSSKATSGPSSARHVEIFLDRSDILDFHDWKVRCHRALRASGFFIVLLSPAYLRSDACRREWRE